MKHSVTNINLAGVFVTTFLCVALLFYKTHSDKTLQIADAEDELADLTVIGKHGHWSCARDEGYRTCLVFSEETRRLDSDSLYLSTIAEKPSHLFSILSPHDDLFWTFAFHNATDIDANVKVKLHIGDKEFQLNSKEKMALSKSFEDTYIMELMRLQTEVKVSLNLATGASDIITFKTQGFEAMVKHCELVGTSKAKKV